MKSNDMKCPKCGSKNITEGKSNFYTQIELPNKPYGPKYDVYLEFCKDCGYVVNIWVGKSRTL